MTELLEDMTTIIDLALHTIITTVIVVIVAMIERIEVGEDEVGEGEAVMVEVVEVTGTMIVIFVHIETLAGLAGQEMKVKKKLRGEKNIT